MPLKLVGEKMLEILLCLYPKILCPGLQQLQLYFLFFSQPIPTHDTFMSKQKKFITPLQKSGLRTSNLSKYWHQASAFHGRRYSDVGRLSDRFSQLPECF